jgi:hypothetical protein
MGLLRSLRSFFTQADAWIELRPNGDGTQREVMVMRDRELGGWKDVERPYERVGERGGKTNLW